ncbi:MAG: recombination mediator RecR [Chloroflexota bacterium]|nr:recombination mediator RecR [Chloroflexota bacterium]
MRITAEPVERLIEEFSRLPGIGPKTASRLTFWLLRGGDEQARSLADAIRELKEKTTLCSQCFNITDTDPCAICSNPNRDHSVICVVEEPLNVLAIERAHEYRGLYHVLHGRISPLDGLTPEKLKLQELRARVGAGGIGEVIIATNPTTEGFATAHYISRILSQFPVKVTRLAHGLPMGGDLDYADEVTISRALQGRQEITEPRSDQNGRR